MTTTYAAPTLADYVSVREPEDRVDAAILPAADAYIRGYLTAAELADAIIRAYVDVDQPV